MTPLERLRVDLDLGWVRDERGRLVRANTPEHRPPPALVVATAVDGAGHVWAVSDAVPDGVAAQIDAALHDDPDDTARLLALLGPHGAIEVGSSYVLPDPPPAAAVPPPPPGIEVRTSVEPDAEDVRVLVPAPDRALTAPWAIALVDGEVAAVCESARLRPSAAAAGVWTYEPHRRRGLATAVVAAWAGLVDGTPHYGHDETNVASAGVARRVGFQPIGSWWWVRPPSSAP